MENAIIGAHTHLCSGTEVIIGSGHLEAPSSSAQLTSSAFRKKVKTRGHRHNMQVVRFLQHRRDKTRLTCATVYDTLQA